jgi:hypothetical protein
MTSLALLLILATPSPNYSTCPALQDAVLRNVGYVSATEGELRHWAKKKVVPKSFGATETIKVQLQVEGEKVFCAEALNGSPEKQKAAVDAAMKWRFQKNRGSFKSDLMGSITLGF